MNKIGVENVRTSASGCHEYLGCLLPNGYAKIRINGKTMLGHRAAWLKYRGPIPDGIKVLHRCDNRKCLNPEHLFLGTSLDNSRDMEQKGRHNYIGLTDPLLRKQPTKAQRARGSRSGTAKLTESDVRRIREAYLRAAKQTEMAVMYGVSQATIQRITSRTHWTHVE